MYRVSLSLVQLTVNVACRSVLLFFLIFRRPRRPTLFPYTTLFRSIGACLDTAHLFAAGYDIKGEDGLASTIGQIDGTIGLEDRKSTRLNSSHQINSYAVFCLKKKKKKR